MSATAGAAFATVDSLRVAYVVSMRHGLQSFVFREIRELEALGVEAHIFPTRVGSGPYAPRKDWYVHRARLVGLASAHVRSVIRDARRYIKVLQEAIHHRALVDFAMAAFVSERALRSRIPLIHCHFGDHKFFIGYFASLLGPTPVSVTIHAYELYNNPNPGMLRKALQSAAAIVTVSAYNKRILGERYGVARDRIHLIPLFADCPDDTRGPAAKNGCDADGNIKILTVARLVEKKGHRTLVEALSMLPDNYEAWIVGEGPLDVVAMAKAAGVDRRVRMFGQLSDEALQAAYRSATMFCLPSETAPDGDREGIPVAIMEAMAHGLPVVTTRHAGIPELVEEVLVDEGNANELARALRELGQSPERRDTQGHRNRKKVQERFSRNNVASLKSLFERLVNGST